MSSNNNPLSFTRIAAEATEEIHKSFKGLQGYENFVRVGPKGYLHPEYIDIEHQLASVRNVSLRNSDIFVVSFPRSGTTWTQELIWLIANDLDYFTAKDINIIERYHFFEFRQPKVYSEKRENQCGEAERLFKTMNDKWTVDTLNLSPDPRFIKSHIPFSLLPPSLLDMTKVVYVARDPRDVAVSYYHLNRWMPISEYKGSFKTFWNLFVKDMCLKGPYFEHVKEAWEKRDHPNCLFLFYEELSEKLPETIHRICKFLGKEKYTNEQINELCEHVKFENFKKNPSANMNFLKDVNHYVAGVESTFIRKGKCGGWRDYFDDEMTKQAEAWIEENLRNTDLRFPQVSTTV